MRKLKIFFVTFVCLLSSNIAYTLGVGDIEVSSALNQPLDARIKLYSVRPGEGDNVRVTLASAKDFANAGVERVLILSSLKFRVIENGDGTATIKVTSRKPIKEPFLNFLIDVDWQSGRILREYTILLDPPVFAQRKATPVQAPRASAPAPAKAPKVSAAPRPRPIPPAPVVRAPVISPGADELFPRLDTGSAASKVERGVSAARVIVISGDSYKAKRNDTLWSIASSLRSDASINIEQIMIAILRLNPEAFINNNIHGLKAGFVLRIPERDIIESINKIEALRLAREQGELWRSARESITAGETPIGTPVASAGKLVGKIPVSGTQPGVKLVTPKPDIAAGAQGAGTGDAKTAEQLALVNEQLASKQQENSNLQGRVTSLQDQISSMERLLDLKDESLAELQNKLGKQEDKPAPVPASVKLEPVVPELQVKKPEQIAAVTPYIPPGTAKAQPVPVVPRTAITKPIPKPSAPPKKDEGIFGLVQQMLDDVVVLGVAIFVLVLVIALIWIMINRRRMNAMQFPESILTGKPAVAGADDAMTRSAGQETSLLSDFAPTAMNSSVEEVGEVDPLSEADVYIAYNKHQQAEDLLKNAIGVEPDRLDLKLKLMEVYHSAKNADAFQSIAEEIHGTVDGQSAALWDKAVEMGRELCPDHELFRDASGAPEDDFSDLEGIAELDELEAAFTDSSTEDSAALDIEDLAEPETTEEVAEEPAADDLALDIDDLSLEFDTSATAATEPEAEYEPEPIAEAPAADESVADIGLDEVATKLDLAKAYIDMGDPDGARAILDEVISEGNDTQKTEAQGLIAQL